MAGIGLFGQVVIRHLHGLELERGKDNEINIVLYTLTFHCPFIHNRSYPTSYPKMAGEGQYLLRQRDDKGTIIIKANSMALLRRILSW